MELKLRLLMRGHCLALLVSLNWKEGPHGNATQTSVNGALANWPWGHGGKRM